MYTIVHRRLTIIRGLRLASAVAAAALVVWTRARVSHDPVCVSIIHPIYMVITLLHDDDDLVDGGATYQALAMAHHGDAFRTIARARTLTEQKVRGDWTQTFG